MWKIPRRQKKCKNYLHLIEGKWAVFFNGYPPKTIIENVHEEFIPSIVFNQNGNEVLLINDCLYAKSMSNVQTHNRIQYHCKMYHTLKQPCSNTCSGFYDHSERKYHMRFTSDYPLVLAESRVIFAKVDTLGNDLFNYVDCTFKVNLKG